MPADAPAAGPASRTVCVPEDEVELRYAAWSIWADLARGCGGLALVLALLAGAAPPWPVALPLGAVGGLFAVFVASTYLRGRSFARLNETGIAIVSPRGRREIAWRDLDRFRLRWFGPRRAGAGWLDLELRGGGERLSLTSGLTDFERVLERAACAAERNALALDPASRANLAELRGARTPAGSSGPRG